MKEEPLPAGRVLLHACCAPCSSAIVEWLLAHGVRPTIYYSNPNIFPAAEYARRRDECQRFCAAEGLEFVEAAYDHAAWLDFVRGLEDEPERGARCLRCFLLRLRGAAAYAHGHGFAHVATTLASSRWKSLAQIEAAGREATAEFADVEFWARNWRKGGLQDRRNALLRQWGFYNQRYCGCEFSKRQEEERAAQRAENKSANPLAELILPTNKEDNY